MKAKIYLIQSIHKLSVNGGFAKSYVRLLFGLFFLLTISTSVQAQTTLNPVADTDTHSDVTAGTNATLNSSQWTHLFLRFDLASISGSVTGATLRIYQKASSGAYTLNVNTTSTDSWNEGGTKPALGTLITSRAGRTTAGYIDINLTSHVQGKMGGNKIVSVALSTNLGTWTPFSSRQSSTNKPQLVIVTGSGSGNNLTVTPTTLNFGSAASSNNISVTSNVSWTVSDNQSWITTSPTSGSNNGTVSVSVTANTGTASRTGSVTMTGGSITRTVSISQNASSSSSGMAMGSNFHGDFQWSSSGQNNRLFRTGITNWAAETNPWDPTTLSDIDAANYKVLRSMDWQSTNWSRLQDWSQRTKKGDNHYNAAQWQGDDIALEWIIDICNRLDMHLWVCMPHRASDDFMRKFAQALKFGTQSNGEPYTSAQASPWSPPLKSTLKVFVEYSNETWNTTFAFRNREGQFDYVVQRGQALGLPGSDRYYQGQSFHALRSIQMFKIFSDVFNAAPARAGLEKVFAGSGAFDWMKQALVNIFESSTHNPNGIYPTVFATAPYVGSGLNGADPNILNLFKAEVDDHLTTWGQVAEFKREVVDFWNGRHPGNTMKFAAYEGGQHLWGDAQNPDNFFANPQSYDAYMYMFEKFKPYFFVFCHFMHCTEVKSSESWGAKSYYGQPDSQAHKYRAIKDFMTQNPANLRLKTSVTDIPEYISEPETTEGNVQVYPNPVRSKMMEVMIRAEKKSEAVISMFTSGSEKVVDLKRSLTPGSNSIQISTDHLNDGLHLLIVNKENERIVRKVIIKK